MVVSANASSYNAGTIAVGNSSATLTASVNITRGNEGPAAISVVTQGVTGLDFNVVNGGGTCANLTGFYPGQTCTVTYSFKPTRPGTRYGAIVLTSSSGAVLGTSFLNGTGTGPQVTFLPDSGAPLISLGGGFVYPVGIAVDAGDNAYVTEQTTSVVKKVPAGCTTSSCVTTVGGGFSAPTSVALDGAGNLYVGDFSTNSVRVVPPGCTSSSCVTTAGGGYQFIEQVATDTAGNVYVADLQRMAVVMVPAGCTTAACTSTLGGGYSRPEGVTVGGDGTVYVADNGANAILQFPNTCQTASCVTTRYTTTQPYHLAVDGENNLYFTTFNGNSIQELPAGCSTSSCVVTIAAANTSTFGVAVDGSSNVYVTDAATPAVRKIDLHDPPALTFTSTPVGSQSAQQVVTLTNSGNVTALAISALNGTNANFGGAATTCAVGTPVAAGASCKLGVQFAPTTAGSPLSGSATITDNNLNVGGSTQSFGVSGVATPTSKTITFTPLATPVALGSTATLSATASNGDPVTFSILTNNATLTGNTVTYTTAGTVTIAANSAAMGNYTAAPQVTQTVTVNQGMPTVSWTMPAAIPYGPPLSATQLNATASYAGNTLPGTFTYNPPAGTVLAAGTQTLNVTFVPTDAANYKSAPGSTTILVNKTTPKVTWTTPAAIVYGTALSATQLNATATNPITGATVAGAFTYNPGAGAVLGVGVQTLGVTFVPTDAADYSNATGSTNLVVNRATPAISWATPAAISYGTALSATQLNATAANPVTGAAVAGTFTYSPVTGTVLAAGTQPLTVTFVPTDGADYNSGAGSTTILVNKSTPAITWAAPAAIAYGTPLSGTQLNAAATNPATGAAVAGTFTYNPPAGTVLPAGTSPLNVTFTPTDTADYNNATGSTSITVTSGTLTLTWPQPAPVTFGTALSSTQLNATATDASGTTVPGVFTYAPPAGTILTAGTQTLGVTFVPTDTSNYSTKTATQTIAVNPATPVIGFPAAAGAVTDIAVPYTPTGNTLYQSNWTEALQGNQIAAAPKTGSTGTGITFGNYVGRFNATAAGSTSSFSFTPVPLNSTAVVHALFNTFKGSPNPDAVVTFTNSAGQTAAYTLVGNQTIRDYYDNTTNNYANGLQGYNSDPSLSGVTTTTWWTNYTSASGYVRLDVSTFALPTAWAGTNLVSVQIANPANSSSDDVLSAMQVMNGGSATLAAIPYGTALSATQLNATATNPITGGTVSGTFAYNPTAGTVLPAGTQNLGATFVPADAVDYTTATSATSLVVNKATPVITWATPAPINAGTPLSATQLNAVATNPVTGAVVPGVFTYTPAAGTLLPNGNNTLNVSFVPMDLANYTNATGSVTQVVNSALTTTMLMSTLNPSTFGQPVTLTATVASPYNGAILSGMVSFLDGTFLLGSGPISGGMVSITTSTLAAGTHNISAVYGGDANFASSSSAALAQIVNRASTVVSWITPATIVYGTPLSGAQLNATATTTGGVAVPGTFLYIPAAGTVLSAGTQRLTVAFTPSDAANFAASTGQVNLVVTPASPAVAWTAPPSITAGTPLSSTQLNATATGVGGTALPGTFTYTPAAGTILPVGTATLRVTFTPADAVDYGTATGSVPLTVTPATTSNVLTSSANPSVYGQAVMLTATLSSAFTASPITGTVNFADGTTPLGSGTISGGVATLTTTALTTGTHSIRAAYGGDANFTAVTSAVLTQTVTAGVTALAWTTPAAIVYGTPLSSTQLNATVSAPNAATVPGTFAYTPTAGTVLTAGTQTLRVVFTPTDTLNFKTATATVTLIVSQAAPVITWATPSDVVAGTTLSATQLNATATGVGGTALPGVFVYNPASGTVLTAGVKTLSVTFTPTDATDYTVATRTVNLNVIGVALTSLTPSAALLGDTAKTITLTGTGFVSNSVVTADGAVVPTTFVNGTTLTAVIPASDFTTVHTIPVFVTDPTQAQTTNTLTIAIAAAPLNATVTAPSSTTPGAQPTVSFNLTNTYPVPVTATFTMTFTPASGLPNDPNVLFSNGTRTVTVTVPAGSSTPVPLLVQAGSVAGTITITSTFTAGGATITPSGGAQTVTIASPTAVPGITSTTLTRNGNSLTVTTLIFSNTRAVDHVSFHFVAAAGQKIGTPDVTVDGSLFTAYYSSQASLPYGSAAVYTQTFTLDEDASVVGEVDVTVANAIGNSQAGSAK